MLALLLFLRLLMPADEVMFVPSELRLRLVEEVNRDRAAAGRAPVIYSEELSRAADEHCRAMLVGNYMSHWNQAGWKPYLRYASAGIRDATAENVWSMWKYPFDRDAGQLWAHMLSGHRGFMAEKPPHDGHRQSVLGARHTHVGIGAAYDSSGIRMIELFGARHAELEPLPPHATLKDSFLLRGRVLKPGHALFAVTVYYEPLPRPMTRSQLLDTASYGLPVEEQTERVALQYGLYADGSAGSIQVERSGRFSVPLRWWKGRPGVYTVGVWLRESGQREGFLGAMTSVIVSEK